MTSASPLLRAGLPAGLTSPSRTGSPGRSPVSSCSMPSPYHNHHHQQQQQQQHHHSIQHHLQQLMGYGSPTLYSRYPPAQIVPSCMYSFSPGGSLPSPVPSAASLNSPALSTDGALSPLHNSKLGNKLLLFKENNPSPPPVSPLSGAYPLSNPSPVNVVAPKNCKRRLDFNHNLNEERNANFDLDAAYREIGVSLTLTHEDNLGVLLASAHAGFKGSSSLQDCPQRQQHQQQQSQDLDLTSTPGRPPTVAVARRNERERNRVKLINMTFATLREHLPQYASKSGKNRKMSKVETLRAAIDYIRQLQTLTKENHVIVKAEVTEEDTEAETEVTTSLGVDAEPRHAVELLQVASYDVTSVLQAAGLPLELDAAACLSAAKAAVAAAVAAAAASSSSSAGLQASSASPLSSAGAPRSPSSDDCCSGYDHLSPEEDDLLDLASWF